MDLELIANAGYNVVKTYELVWDKKVLDKMQELGLMYLAGFSDYDLSSGRYERWLRSFARHPAVLGYVFGNEYNRYSEMRENDRWYKLLAATVKSVRQMERAARDGSAARGTPEYIPGRLITTAQGGRKDAGLFPTDLEWNRYFKPMLAAEELNFLSFNGYFKTVQELNQFVNLYRLLSNNQPLFLSEIGRPSYIWRGTEERSSDNQQYQRDFISQVLSFSRDNVNLIGSGIFEFADNLLRKHLTQTEGETGFNFIEHKFGLFEHFRQPKSAAYSLIDLLGLPRARLKAPDLTLDKYKEAKRILDSILLAANSYSFDSLTPAELKTQEDIDANGLL